MATSSGKTLAAIIGPGNIGTERYRVPAPEILRECGEYGYVGGQGDLIFDIAIQLAAERDLASSVTA